MLKKGRDMRSAGNDKWSHGYNIGTLKIWLNYILARNHEHYIGLSNLQRQESDALHYILNPKKYLIVQNELINQDYVGYSSSCHLLPLFILLNSDSQPYYFFKVSKLWHVKIQYSIHDMQLSIDKCVIDVRLLCCYYTDYYIHLVFYLMTIYVH